MMRDITKLLAPWVRELDPYPPGKPIDELEREYGIIGSIKLASNESALGPSPLALQAVRGALGDVHRYPDGGTFHLRRRLAEKFGLRPEQFIVGNGSNELIELITRAFVRPGDDVVMADQAFVIYRMAAQAAAATPRIVPLKDFTHDLEGMAAAVTPRTRAVFLANPNNPTGTIYRRDAWAEFLRSVPPDVVVVADEAYGEFVEDPDYPISVFDHSEGRLLITLRTFSKIYGLAGLRIGYGVASAEVIAALHRVRQPFNVNALAQVAAAAALADEDHVARSRSLNREGMSFIRAACERLSLSVVPSHANFLLIDVKDGAPVYEALLGHGVIVRPMGVYRLPRHIRVTVGTEVENRRFVDALEAVLSVRLAAGKMARRHAPASRSRTRASRAPAAPLFDRMAVLGVGLIGGSLALAAKEAGVVSRIIGCGRTEENLRIARQRGAIDAATKDAAEAVGDVDLVLLAVPVGALRSVAEAIVPHLAPGTVVTDVTSVKKEVVAILDRACADAGCSFVGGHPITGSEEAGARAADAMLFRNNTCILTPTDLTNSDALAKVRTLWTRVGMIVEQMDAATHDAILARVSHLPHLVAYALSATVGGATAGGRRVAEYVGPGFCDTTRIAASPAALWREISLANREQVLQALAEFSRRLDQLQNFIHSEDTAKLEVALENARAQRQDLGMVRPRR